MATVVLLAAVTGSMPAYANSTPNPYTSVGTSWIDVNPSEKVWFEDFEDGDHDDSNIFFVETGVSCTINGVTATGPFLAGDDAGTAPSEDDCTKDGNAFDPIDTDTGRVGAHPIGFDVNFFGTTYSDLYFNTNGGIFFDEPTDRYNRSLTEMAVRDQTSGIAPMMVDLYFDSDESSVWTAQTTLGGKQAFIISWQEFDECCEDATPDTNSTSFQFVFINEGEGDFTAYFNYDDVYLSAIGYYPASTVDMRNDVTVGSNIVRVNTVEGLREGVCEAIYYFDDEDNAVSGAASFGPGDLTDSSWDDNAKYMKLVSSSDKTVSVWQDSSCTSPNNISAIQDIETDGIEYVSLKIENLFEENPTFSFAIGWGTFDPTTGATEVTEIFPNGDGRDLLNGGSNELIAYSLNTTVPGRIVLGQVNGGTVGDPDTEEEPSAPVIRQVSYYGPVNLVAETVAKAAGTARVKGLNLDTITAISVGGINTDFTINSDGSLTFDVPNLEDGIYELKFLVSKSNLNLVTRIQVYGKTSELETSGNLVQKVNAGSFKGYVALYAKGHEGKRLSAKVGKDWVIIPSIPAAANDLYRVVEYTGAGVDVAIRIYIDRVLIETINLTTK
ncbi:MAG: hypothetical protein K9G68_06500 [Aquiluna sp.]|nr:hypothetical protein [Aquiluna sp.]